MAHLEADGVAAAAGPQGQAARVAEGDDGDHGVGGLAPADRVAVPGDGVAAVAIEAAAGGHEPLAELGLVVVAESLARRGQQRVGEVLVDDVGVHKARHVDDPVVHLPALGPPRHVGYEALEDVVGADDEVGQHVDPGPAGQRGAAGAVERPHPGCGGHAALEEGALEVHDNTVRRDRTFVRYPEPDDSFGPWTHRSGGWHRFRMAEGRRPGREPWTSCSSRPSVAA